MIARIFPVEAKSKAVKKGILLFKATKKVASEEKGRIVAAKKAERKSISSAI